MICIGMMIGVNSCKTMPQNAQPVSPFDVQKYLGTWYEIARFDFKFERDLNNVSAQYRLGENGEIQVLNSGYNTVKKEWTKADGIAKFRGDENVAALKVSFFGPFYSGYNVISIDNQYQYALVAGKSLDYLWILSRTKSIPEAVKNQYIEIAKELGYQTDKLLWIAHDRSDNPYLNE